MVSRNFILPEFANYVFSYYFFLRNLLYLILLRERHVLYPWSKYHIEPSISIIVYFRNSFKLNNKA